MSDSFSSLDHGDQLVMRYRASGLWVCTKRLEKGRFHWPEAAPGTKSVKLRAEELAMLVNGIDLKQTRPRRGWFRLERAS